MGQNISLLQSKQLNWKMHKKIDLQHYLVSHSLTIYRLKETGIEKQ